MNRLELRQPAALLFGIFSRLNISLTLAKQRTAVPIWSLLGDGQPIRRSLLLLAVLPAVLVLLTLGFTISHVAKEQIQQTQGEKLRTQAAFFTKNIDQAIDRHLVDIKSRAALLPKFNLHTDYQQLKTWMLTVQSEVTDYTWIGFADREGVVRVSTHTKPSLQSVREMSWFERSLGQPVVIDADNIAPPFVAKGLSNLQPRAIYLAAPVYSEQGEVLGVLIGFLGWEWVLNQLAGLAEQLAIGQQGDVFIASANGAAYLVSKDASKIQFNKPSSIQRTPHQGSGWYQDAWTDQKNYLIGYAKANRQQHTSDSGWTTLVRLPIDHIHADISPLLTGLWFIIIATIAGLIAITGLLLRITLRPIESLINTINQVADHDGRIPTTRPTPREFQVLTSAVNRMIQAIQDRELENQAKTQLLADMSHEIRTPLHGLIGYAELIKGRLANPEDQADMYRLITYAREMTTLANDALDLSAIELQKLRFKPQSVLLKELVDVNVEMFRSLAIQQGLFFDLEHNADPDLRLFVDRLRVGQILRNLFSNAVKFTAKGGVRVVIGALVKEYQSDTNNQRQEATITIEVSDSGIGIAHDQRSKLFSRYHQAHTFFDTESGRLKIGSGLGLHVTRALVVSMGGSIELDSELGLGTRVRVELSLPLVSDQTPVAMTSPEHAAHQPERLTLRILLVEDSADNRDVMRRWLVQQGHQVTTADSGEVGLALARQQTYDLILLDVHLPDGDGRMLARSIRESRHANARAKIFVLSGRTGHHDHQSSLNAGIDLHLDKPLDFDQFRYQLGLVGRNTFGSA